VRPQLLSPHSYMRLMRTGTRLEDLSDTDAIVSGFRISSPGHIVYGNLGELCRFRTCRLVNLQLVNLNLERSHHLPLAVRRGM
jgi:hypothetical protein